jgi:hypothetical protein
MQSTGARPSWRVIAVFLALSMGLTAPLLYPLLQEAMQHGNTSFLLQESDSIPSDIFSPFVPPWFVWLIRGIYIGAVPFFLATVALGRKRREAAVWIILLLLAYLISVGPSPLFLGRPVPVTLPWSTLVVPLLRSTYRLNILVSFGLAMVVAYGWLATREQIVNQAYRVIAGCLAVGLLVLDYLAAPFPVTEIRVPYFYVDCLAQQANVASVAIIPSGRQVDKLHMYFQIYHGKMMTGGTISRTPEDAFAFLESNALLRAGRTENWPPVLPSNTLPAIRHLALNDVDLLILEKAVVEEADWMEAIPLVPIYEDADVLVYDPAEAVRGSKSELGLCNGQ